MEKVIVIGLDGATWNLLIPWIESGQLPNMETIINKGVRAELLTTNPPVTIPAWTSFITGCNPGKHGIFNFVYLRNGKINLHSSKDIKHPTVYETLSDRGISNIIISLPMSYPPPKSFKGIMLSDFQYPIKSIFPKSKEKYLDNYVELHNVKKKGEELLDDMIKTAQKQIQTAKELFYNEDWRFFFFYFPETDSVCHSFWRDITEKTYIGKKTIKIFEIADNFIGWVLNKMSKNDILFIVSDHGFGTFKYNVHVNTLLKNKGLLKTKTIVNDKKKLVSQKYQNEFRKYNNATIFKLFIETLSFPLIKKILLLIGNLKGAFRITHGLGLIIHKLTDLYIYKDVKDFDNSLAYVLTSESMGVYINKNKKIKNKIISLLKNLKYKNKFVFRKILMNNEVYSGEYANLGPDIVLIPNGFHISSTGSEKIFTPYPPYGYHTLRGIFIAYGVEIKEGFNMGTFSIYDLAPTILHFLDLPIPSNTDGKVLKMIYKEGSQKAKRPIKSAIEIDKIKKATKSVLKKK